MFGRRSDVNPLAARKQLLIAESELNRAQLIEDWQTMAEGVRGITKRARSIGTLASSAVSLLTGMVSYAKSRPEPAAAKSSWFEKLVGGARLASTIWLALRPRGTNSEDSQPRRRRD